MVGGHYKKCEHKYSLIDKFEKRRKMRGTAAVTEDVYGNFICEKCLRKETVLLKRGF